MSSLYRSAISARLPKQPNLPPSYESPEGDEEISPIYGGMGPPPMSDVFLLNPRRTLMARICRPAQTARPKARKKHPALNVTPVSASDYFAQAFQVSVASTQLDHRVYYTPPKFADGSLMVFHHGAGYSGLTFACLAKEVGELSMGECGVLSVDARRHGESVEIDIHKLTFATDRGSAL